MNSPPSSSQRGQYGSPDSEYRPVNRNLLNRHLTELEQHIEEFLPYIKGFIEFYKDTQAGKEVADFLDEKLLFQLEPLIKTLPESDKQERLRISKNLGDMHASWRRGGSAKTSKRTLRKKNKYTRSSFHN